MAPLPMNQNRNAQKPSAEPRVEIAAGGSNENTRIELGDVKPEQVETVRETANRANAAHQLGHGATLSEPGTDNAMYSDGDGTLALSRPTETTDTEMASSDEPPRPSRDEKGQELVRTAKIDELMAHNRTLLEQFEGELALKNVSIKARSFTLNARRLHRHSKQIFMENPRKKYGSSTWYSHSRAIDGFT